MIVDFYVRTGYNAVEEAVVGKKYLPWKRQLTERGEYGFKEPEYL